MKAGKADWHDDWARRDVKYPASLTLTQPHQSAALSIKTVCKR